MSEPAITPAAPRLPALPESLIRTALGRGLAVLPALPEGPARLSYAGELLVLVLDATETLGQALLELKAACGLTTLPTDPPAPRGRALLPERPRPVTPRGRAPTHPARARRRQARP